MMVCRARSSIALMKFTTRGGLVRDAMDARASLIHQYGGAAGNQLMLQLVMDALALTPPHPTFLEARDAILLADRVNNGGTNQTVLWAAFARRGMGVSATVPVNSEFLIGVHESVRPARRPGHGAVERLLVERDLRPIISAHEPLLRADQCRFERSHVVGHQNCIVAGPFGTGGTLPPGGAAQVIVTLDSSVTNLPTGAYSDLVLFSNVTSGQFSTRSFEVRVQGFATLPFSDGFESGSFGPSWLATGAGPWREQVTSQNGPRGSFHVTMDSSVSNRYAINELTLGVNLDGYTNVVLAFWGRDYAEDLHSTPTPFENRADVDGVMSAPTDSIGSGRKSSAVWRPPTANTW